MKKALLSLFVLAAVFALIPPEVQAQPTGSINLTACSNIKSTGLTGLVNCAIGFFNAGIYLLVSLAVLFTILGAFEMISSETKRESGRQRVIYGIIGIFVMVSVWGFVNILQNTFGIGGDKDTRVKAPTFQNI